MTILFKYKNNIKGFLLSSQIKPLQRAEPCTQQANAQPQSQPLKPSDHLHLIEIPCLLHQNKGAVCTAPFPISLQLLFFSLQTFQDKIQHPRALEDA